VAGTIIPYHCTLDLATHWPNVLQGGHMEVADLRTTKERNGVVGCAGTVREGRAEVRVAIGPGAPGKGWDPGACHLLLIYRRYFVRYKLSAPNQTLAEKIGSPRDSNCTHRPRAFGPLAISLDGSYESAKRRGQHRIEAETPR
jgi:hypothetical protein